MRTGKRPRPVLRGVTAALALLLATGAGAVVAPVPASADTVRGLQWYLDALKIPQAHKQTKGRGVVVAVVDTGVDASHPDLRGQVLAGKGIGSGTSADGRTDPDTEVGHGTGMAGIIAGRGGGEMRQLGIAPEAKVLPVSLGTDFGDDDIAAGIRWAADSGADVINLSLGGARAPTEVEQAAVRYALGKDVVLVAGAGNTRQGMSSVIAPASISGVIAVSGLDKAGRFSSESVQGAEVVASAPAEAIISPRPFAVSANGYGVGTFGTSDASAVVAGVAALIRAKYPDLDAANVINRLISTARDEGPNGRDAQYGFGAVEPVAALTRSVPKVRSNPLLPDGAPGGVPDAGDGDDGGDDDGGSWFEFGVTNSLGAVIQIGFCLLVVVLVVVLIVVGQRSSRRRRPPAPVGAPPGAVPQVGGPPVPAPAPPPPPPPAGAWSGYPPPVGPPGPGPAGHPPQYPPGPQHPGGGGRP